MKSITSRVEAEIAKRGLNKAEATRAIGVTYASLIALLAGKSKPNARTIGRYEAFVSGKPEKAVSPEKKPKSRGKSSGPVVPARDGAVTNAQARKALKWISKSLSILVKAKAPFGL